MIAAEVALAFNAINERKSWAARPYASDGSETVHFTAPANLVTIVMECGDTPRFYVRFNKVQAAWGDYVRAIARSLHVVLSTLKAAGLPFNSPDDDDECEIVANTTTTTKTYVSYPGMIAETVEGATMPELLSLVEAGEYPPAVPDTVDTDALRETMETVPEFSPGEIDPTLYQKD